VEKNFISENEKALKGLNFIRESFDNKGIKALDRGYDNKKFYKHFFENIRVRSLNSIRTINLFLTLIIEFIAMMSKIKTLTGIKSLLQPIFKIKASQQLIMPQVLKLVE
jgi:hypothetical protein